MKRIVFVQWGKLLPETDLTCRKMLQVEAALATLLGSFWLTDLAPRVRPDCATIGHSGKMSLRAVVIACVNPAIMSLSRLFLPTT
ncbi:hypothetical protein QA641_24210 [Bradyrhizobium sp. CB1650]|uniref:hypothetical protein n=1 Tax=Bradyrhizobium sp. CB1650 TaxID=3039153 RepID=UPI002435354D|nr:hypothetical protein [Bradyrhizobium sp. CB1650]WGD48750.1 hypothetical protein QA641_24210 [Bradyrhizobium sp. CB1650]